MELVNDVLKILKGPMGVLGEVDGAYGYSSVEGCLDSNSLEVGLDGNGCRWDGAVDQDGYATTWQGGGWSGWEGVMGILARWAEGWVSNFSFLQADDCWVEGGYDDL